MMDNINSNSFFIDLRSEPFANVAYHVSGDDSHLKRIHSHDGFEIMQIWSNDGYVLIDGRVYPMKEGAIYLVNGIESHSTNPTDEKNYIRNKITFSPSYIRNILEQMDMPHLLELFSGWVSDRKVFFVFSKEAAELVDRLFMDMEIEMTVKQQGYTAYTTACLIKMLILIHRFSETHLSSASDYPSHAPHIHSITQYIALNLQNFNLDMMCMEIPISKYYACHLFKRITGITLMDYVLAKRISMAKKLLLTTEKLVSQISMETGFSSFTLFCRTFKRITGVRPLEYRKNIFSIIK